MKFKYNIPVFFCLFSSTLIFSSCLNKKEMVEDKDLEKFISPKLTKEYLSSNIPQSHYTILSRAELNEVILNSDQKISEIINNVKELRKKYENKEKDEINTVLVDYLSKTLSGINYAASDATGEWNGTANDVTQGDCESTSPCVQQAPLYRVDKLDCFTLVTLMISILNSKDLNEFKENFVRSSYGTYYNKFDNEKLNTIAYYNRNHFTDPDWTEINSASKFIKEFTAEISNTPQSEMIATITRKNWFTFEQTLNSKIRVFNSNIGENAYNYFVEPQVATSLISKLSENTKFESEIITTKYIPTALAIEHTASIPTPSVVSIVRDPVKWKIKDYIGSELTISHMGIIYEKNFQKDDLIYREISCSPKENDKPRDCKVENIICNEDHCKKTMFLNASNAYPNDYFYYSKPGEDSFACTMHQPEGLNTNSTCNRVLEIPLEVYLNKYKNISSIVGIHVDRIL